MKKQFIVAAISALCLSSCYCDKHMVGNVDPYEPLVHVASVHHAHFLGGIGVNKDRVTNELPGVENYVIESKHTFGDMFISGLSLGIYTPSTTKYYVPKKDSRVVTQKKKFMSKAYKGYLKR